MAENETPDNEMWSGGTPGAPATRAELAGIIEVRLAEIEARLNARLEKLAGPGLSYAELLARFALDEHEHDDYAETGHDHDNAGAGAGYTLATLERLAGNLSELGGAVRRLDVLVAGDDTPLARRVARLEQDLAGQTGRIDRLAAVVAEQGGRTLATTAALEGSLAEVGARIDGVVDMAGQLNGNLARLGSIFVGDLARRLAGLTPDDAARLDGLARELRVNADLGDRIRETGRETGEAADG